MMLNEAQREHLRQVVMTLRIIVGALVSGVAMFFLVALAMRGDEAAVQPLTAYVAAGFALLGFAASVVVPQVITAPIRKAIATGSVHAGSPVSEEIGDVGRLGALYQTRVIIAAALLEGAAFFNTIAYLIEGRLFSVVVILALMLAVVSLFPTVARVEHWVVNQREIIEQMRSQAQ